MLQYFKNSISIVFNCIYLLIYLFSLYLVFVWYHSIMHKAMGYFFWQQCYMEHHLVKRQFLQSYQTCFIPLSSTNASNWALEFMDPKVIFLYRQKNYFCTNFVLSFFTIGKSSTDVRLSKVSQGFALRIFKLLSCRIV